MVLLSDPLEEFGCHRNYVLLGTKEGINRLGHVIHVVGVKFDLDGDGARDAW